VGPTRKRSAGSITAASRPAPPAAWIIARSLARRTVIVSDRRPALRSPRPLTSAKTRLSRGVALIQEKGSPIRRRATATLKARLTWRHLPRRRLRSGRSVAPASILLPPLERSSRVVLVAAAVHCPVALVQAAITAARSKDNRCRQSRAAALTPGPRRWRCLL
jgi:hypothetical protein